jgi:hypothetical protein
MHSIRKLNGIEIEQFVFLLLWYTTPLKKDKLVMFGTHISSSCLENVNDQFFSYIMARASYIIDEMMTTSALYKTNKLS